MVGAEARGQQQKFDERLFGHTTVEIHVRYVVPM